MSNTTINKEIEFTSPTILVRVTETYKHGMTPEQVYDCTRWAWVASLEHAKKCRLVLAVFGNKVVGAFRPMRWDICNKFTPPIFKTEEQIQADIRDERIAFEGNVADKATWDKFVGKAILMGSTGNPIEYVGEALRQVNHRLLKLD